MSDEFVYPEGTLVNISAEIRIGAAATDSQIREYLQFEMTQSGGCSLKNPLSGSGLKAWSFDCEPTGYVGREEKIDVERLPNGSEQYRLRRTRERLPLVNVDSTEPLR